MNTFETVQAWLRNTYNIGVSAEWLTACLEWIQQENQGLLPATNELVSQVYEQWLLSDLTEIGEPVLPQNLVSAEKSDLISNYPLQLLSVVDVGFPLYGQKQKLKGRVNPNEEVSADKPFQPAWEPKPSRMLLLQLTDGHTQVQAMEYKQIKDLHPELPSGFKLLVTGRVQCRRGVIMLTSECVQVLGGEVDALAEQNTPLKNLENAMIRNREDEGKHASTQLSGRFISRGVDKKMDSLQKPFIKRDGFNRPTNQQTMSKFNPSQVKQETHKSYPMNLKQESGQTKTELLHLKQESEQLKDEINYDDCFNDEFDLEEIEALDSTSATDMGTEICKKADFNSVRHKSDSATSVSGFRQIGNAHDRQRLWNVEDTNKIPVNTLNKSSQLTDKNQAMSSSLHTKPQSLEAGLPGVHENDVEFFDDDFDIDEIPYSSDVPQNIEHKVSKLASSGETLPTTNIKRETTTSFNPSQEPKFPSNSFTNNKNQKMFATSSFPFQQDNPGGNSGRSSSSSLYEKMKPVNMSLKSISSFSGTSQNAQVTKNKLFSIKSNPKKGVIRTQTNKQCSLSDMFRSQSCGNKTKKAEFENDCAIIDDDCTIIDDECIPQSSPLLVAKKVSSPSLSSKLVNMSSVNPSKPYSSSAVSNSNCTTRAARCPDPKKKPKQEDEDMNDNLPKAIIHSFPVSMDCDDLPDTTNSLPFRYLSDLADMQPPASVTVKAYISTLLDKLGSTGGAGWSLACRINDGTACLDVDLADGVLAELIGFSAQDSVLMRQKMKTEPRVKDILMEGLSKCQQKLINMSCLMEVDAESAIRRPVVKRLIPLSRQHFSELIKRVERKLSAKF